MTILECFNKYDKEATSYVLRNGLAKIEVLYYGRKNSVRKIITYSQQSQEEFIENGIIED